MSHFEETCNKESAKPTRVSKRNAALKLLSDLVKSFTRLIHGQRIKRITPRKLLACLSGHTFLLQSQSINSCYSFVFLYISTDSGFKVIVTTFPFGYYQNKKKVSYPGEKRKGKGEKGNRKLEHNEFLTLFIEFHTTHLHSPPTESTR